MCVCVCVFVASINRSIEKKTAATGLRVPRIFFWLVLFFFGNLKNKNTKLLRENLKERKSSLKKRKEISLVSVNSKQI